MSRRGFLGSVLLALVAKPHPHPSRTPTPGPPQVPADVYGPVYTAVYGG